MSQLKELLSHLTSRQSQFGAQQVELERRCAESRSHTDELIRSIRQLKQLSDQQGHIAQPVELIQALPPTTVEYEQLSLADNIINEYIRSI